MASDSRNAGTTQFTTDGSTSLAAAEDEQRLVDGFRDLSAKQYAEIVEECQTTFVKEVEFERFGQNFTFAEAEEIEQDLDKIRCWFVGVQERDWFDAPGRDEVERWLAHCDGLLETFYAEVHTRTAGDTTAGDPDAAELIPPRPLAPLRRPSQPERTHSA